ncbi:hypothetical protein [Actinoplanes derwentensis]|uniref:ABC-2 type transport system permease protein n=1 Tax=Actinoplanes derwentensis TaxID=113562 RepID=A0A1H2AVX0_9ACTN|nr:hypothetical protein [Actinoplanes derwentensis]GID84300.1 hypothetical protein Ade03nite_32240 [Actinoplanes derwentensis]SDT49656.1 hypothetical protein SAMN04489716_4109 [Actinoplanes derwentensis]
MIRAVVAEVIKLVTLPSLALTVMLTWAATGLLRLAGPPGGVLVYSQVGFLVLGVLAAGQEYQGGGQIRASLLAVPRRPLLAVAKFAALAVTAAPAVLVAAVLAGEPAGSGRLVLDVLLAAGVGTILRHPVGATGALLTAYEIGLPVVRPHLPEIVLEVPVWACTSMIVLVAGAVFTRREV